MSISVAILGDISPIGLHLNVAGSKKKFFATFHIRYILGYISVQKKICQKNQKKCLSQKFRFNFKTEVLAGINQAKLDDHS